MTSDHDREVEDQQRFTASLSARIARASRKASKDLSDDVLKILDTYTAKGGFATRQEAQEYLKGYIEPKDRAVLIAAAQRLPEPERTQQLTRLSSAAYNWRMTRAEAIDKAQRLATTRLKKDIKEAIDPVLSRTVQDSTKRANYQLQKQIGFAYSFDMPNRKGIDEVVRGTGVYDKVRLFSQKEMIGVKDIITSGMLSGRKAETLAREVQLQTGKQLYQARRLVRTTIAQASVDAKVKEYRDLGIDEYEIVCTLDERTCPICREYDGKTYRMGKGPMPTFHPNCRCGIRQVLPESVRASMRRAARDVDGKSIQVPASMSFDEWNSIYGKDQFRRKKEVPSSEQVASAIETSGPDGDKIRRELYSEPATHEELYDTVRKRWGKNTQFEKNLDECDLDVMKDVFLEVDSLAEEFPIIMDAVGDMAVIREKGTYAAVFNNFVGGKTMMKVNPYFFSDREYIQMEYEQDLKVGYHPKGTTYRDLLVHEMGHVIERELVARRYPDNNLERSRAMKDGVISGEILKEAYNNLKSDPQYKKSTMKGLRKEISEYALKNSKETLAEALADWHANGDEAKPLSKEIIRILKERCNE